MTRKLLLASAALAVLTAPAFAADLPTRRVEPATPAVYVPVFTWTGLYLGVNAGVGFNQSNNVSVTSPFGVTTVYSQGSNNGFVGGGQVGYNWQTGALVLGLETDIQYADLGRKHEIAGFNYGGSSSNYFGTVRGRVGYAMDRTLLYVTGGLAYGDIGSSFKNDTRVGWTVGGGVEYAFTNNWTAKLEGLYVKIDQGSSYYVDPLTLSTLRADKNSDFGVVRVGLNYKF
jgi:outer membrane immunogenic protein